MMYMKQQLTEGNSIWEKHEQSRECLMCEEQNQILSAIIKVHRKLLFG